MTERIARPELVTECKEPGKGWRRDEYANWWPCDGTTPAKEGE